MTRLSISTAFLAVTASAFLSSATWAQQSSPEYDRYGWGPHMMGWGGGWFGMILVLAVVIAVAVLIIRWLGGPWHATAPHQSPTTQSALDILKERFARGEIDKDEFEERRRILGE